MTSNMSSGVPTWSDTNRSVLLQKMARSLKFGVYKKRDCTIRVAKTKVLIICAVIAQLICAFVFAKAKICFSNTNSHFSKIIHIKIGGKNFIFLSY